MVQQIPIDENVQRVDDTTQDDKTHELAPDLAYRRLAISNVVFFGAPGAGRGEWVLIDVGSPGTGGLIESVVEERFGGARPSAIVLTHGHFDHVGALESLSETWDVPVYAHALERPYLDGTASYPPPDPTVGGGLMSLAAPLYPRGPVDVRSRLRTLPEDGSVPPMPGWRWIFTPGHSVGHVSFWRESDRALIAGDAFITTAQESAYAAFAPTQPAEMHGPPMYYTADFGRAGASVRALAALEPEIAITGHGPGMRGAAMRAALHELADHFDEVAVPRDGRYVRSPAIAGDGSAYR